ncbi:MAG: hypothetical protein KC503_40180, partial [Myxococcales bacterium]|nr:hypothetical protein [Myxococcales bacterium]
EAAEQRRAAHQSTTALAPADAQPRARDEGDDVKQVLLRLVGSLGYLGLLLIERVGLPLFFMLVSAFTNREERPALADRRRRARAALQSSRATMKRLSEGRPSPPQLPPHDEGS